MMEILRSLEPIEENENYYLLQELEEVNQVLFFNSGTYEIGYDLNGEEFFKILYKNSNVIGAYEITFNKDS